MAGERDVLVEALDIIRAGTEMAWLRQGYYRWQDRANDFLRSVALAAPSPEPAREALDVERLTIAVLNVGKGQGVGFPTTWDSPATIQDWLQQILDEYAALSEPREPAPNRTAEECPLHYEAQEGCPLCVPESAREVLDVERLADAMHRVFSVHPDEECPAPDGHMKYAEHIAREYAALREPDRPT